MKPVSLKSDCSACVALCCIGLAFDKSDMFAIDKAAGIACPKLKADHRCGIHTKLKSKGFQGCINYGCDGAGQRVTQALFQGRSWQQEPALLAEMLEAFRGMRQVHARLVLLRAAEGLALSDTQRAHLETLREEISAPETWAAKDLAGYGQSQSAKDIQVFLVSLSGLVSR